jgi:hypothetical protein
VVGEAETALPSRLREPQLYPIAPPFDAKTIELSILVLVKAIEIFDELRVDLQ